MLDRRKQQEEEGNTMVDREVSYRDPMLTAHDVEIKSLAGSLKTLQEDVHDGFERLFSQLQQQSKFPTSTVLMGIFGLISVIALLAGGYIGQPMSEIKETQSWILQQQFDLNYVLGKREHMIDTNTQGLVHLDTVLQREMRLLDDISNERLKGLDEVLQREMRLLGDVLDQKINAINEKLSVSTESRFTAKEGDRMQRQIDRLTFEESLEDRSREVYGVD